MKNNIKYIKIIELEDEPGYNFVGGTYKQITAQLIYDINEYSPVEAKHFLIIEYDDYEIKNITEKDGKVVIDYIGLSKINDVKAIDTKTEPENFDVDVFLSSLTKK